MDFQRKKKMRQVLYSNFSFIILFFFIIVLAKSTYNVYQKATISNKNLSEINKEYDDLKSRQDMLQSELQRLNTENGVEEEIRSKFSVSKPGETVVVVLDVATTTKNSNIENVGLWNKVLSWFR